MELDDKLIKHILLLARLELSPEEQKKISPQLSEILKYIEKLNALDTKNIEPYIHTLEITNIFREDIPGESLSVEDVLKNAPEKERSFFKVPRVIS